ncbi:MAG: T9SS type A sorting domain-containing protein [Flavobacteriales bacterium]|nr:T9SS type A sorting domain-containing protein [Flavobacteriales bacterium]
MENLYSVSRRRAPLRLCCFVAAIACFPNPSNANTFVTYPSHLDGTALLIMDAKGELVRTVMLQNQGVLDLNTRELPSGLYLLTVAGTSFSTKLTVQR